MKKLTINVSYNITNPLHDLIIDTSCEIRDKYGSDWWVDDARYFLHLSLYMCSVPFKNKSKVIKASEVLFNFSKPIQIVSFDLVHTGDGLIMIIFEQDKKLQKYHEKALELFNPLREGILKDKYNDKEYFNSQPKIDQENILNYGYRYVHDRFTPHVTISRIKNRKIGKEIMDKYNKRLVGQKAKLKSLEVHEPVFGEDDRSVMLYNNDLH